MTLTLHFHPLSSYCQKALVGLYELDVAFEKNIVDLSKADERGALIKLWPIGKFPVLRDEARERTVAEASVVVEYADRLDGKGGRLVPSDPDLATTCRMRDRLFDLHVNDPMGKIVTDKLRPEGKHDPFGVEEAKARIESAYVAADEWLREGPWAIGNVFSLADCAAAPALFYADRVFPFRQKHRHLAAYFERLEKRPSFVRAVEEARPYFEMFPG